MTFHIQKFALFYLLIFAAAGYSQNSSHESVSEQTQGIIKNLNFNEASSMGGLLNKGLSKEFLLSCYKGQTHCILEQLKGFWIDGAGGDVSLAGTALKEGALFVGSMNPSTHFGMKMLGIETTQERVARLVSTHGSKVHNLIETLKDPEKRELVALNTFFLLAKIIEQTEGKAMSLGCEQLVEKVCRLIGALGYEISVEIAIATLSAGTANSAALARLAPKLAHILGKSTSEIEPILKAFQDWHKSIDHLSNPKVEVISDRVKNVFSSQSSRTVDANTANDLYFAREFKKENGERVTFNSSTPFSSRKMAKSEGRIIDTISPLSTPLKPGSYTYVISRDGSLSLGRVEDNFEYGVKHVHLAEGREIVSAGEIKVNPDGSILFNNESGTFVPALFSNGVKPDELSQRSAEALQHYLQRPVKYDEDTPLLPREGPTLKRMQELCTHDAFCESNYASCLQLLGRQACQ